MYQLCGKKTSDKLLKGINKWESMRAGTKTVWWIVAEKQLATDRSEKGIIKLGPITNTVGQGLAMVQILFNIFVMLHFM